MARIGSLNVSLSLNSAQFQEGMKRARQNMKRAAQDMAAISRVAGAAGAALGAMGAQAVSAARDVKRLSDVANTTPRTLQRWSAATRTVGIDQEKLSDILKDVNDRIGDFQATGAGPMADFFENIAPKVGVTADQFERLSGPEALQLYVSSLEKAGVSQQQMTFYMEAMASDATLLLPLLRDNATELDRLGDAAENAGAVMSNEAVANLASAGEAADRTLDAYKGLRNEVAGALAPSFERLAESLQRTMQEGGAVRGVFVWLAENAGRIASYVKGAALAFGGYAAAVTAATVATMGFRRALIRTGIGALIVSLGEAIHQLGRIRSATGSWGETWVAVGEIAKGAVNSTVSLVEAGVNRQIGVFRGGFEAISAVWRQLPAVVGSVTISAANATIAGVETMINGAIRRLNVLGKAAHSAFSWLPGVTDDFQGIGSVDLPDISNPLADQARDAGSVAADAFMEGFRTDTISLPPVFSDAGGLREEWTELQAAISSASDKTTDAASANDRLNDALARVAQAGKDAGNAAADGVDEMTEAARRSEAAVKRLQSSLSSGFADVVVGASSAREAIGGVLDQLARSAAQNAANGLLGGLMGGGGGGFGNLLAGVFGAPGFANGTPSAPGGLAWVGERGPELVNLPRGSQVFDSQTSAQMSDGGATRVRVELSGDLEARLLDQANAGAVEVVRDGIEAYDRDVLPRSVGRVSSDPRRIG